VNLRRVVRTVAGGVGLVAGLVATGAVAAVALVALGVPAEGQAIDAPSTAADSTAAEPSSPPPAAPEAPRPPAPPPSVVVVALSLGEPALAAGVVRGRDVVLARGFEVELVRALAARLGAAGVRFVDRSGAPRLLTGAGGSWQLAVAAIRPPRLATPTVALSAPYLTTDQLVLLRRGTARPRTLGDLRTRILCAIRGADGLRAARAVAPAAAPLVAHGPVRLAQLVQTGACDAALVDPVSATRLVEGRTALLGPLAARVPFGDGLVIAVRPGSGIEVLAVNRALDRLRRDGTLARLARRWLGLDPAALPRLR
jgi:ABC-type amino acid transport substrate-binding protein